jgi:hypothetical protein
MFTIYVIIKTNLNKLYSIVLYSFLVPVSAIEIKSN